MNGPVAWACLIAADAVVTAVVVLAQDARRVEVWSRTEAGSWSHASFAAGQTFELASVACHLAVDDLYAAAGLDVA